MADSTNGSDKPLGTSNTRSLPQSPFNFSVPSAQASRISSLFTLTKRSGIAEVRQIELLILPLVRGVEDLSELILRQESSPLRQGLVLSSNINEATSVNSSRTQLRAQSEADFEDRPTPEKKRSIEHLDSNVSPWRDESMLLEKQLGRIFLWRFDFGDEDLEIILHESYHIPRKILECLSSIGQTLINILQLSEDAPTGQQDLYKAAERLKGVLQKCMDYEDDPMAEDPQNNDDSMSEYSDLSLATGLEAEETPVLDALGLDIDELYALAPAMKKLLRSFLQRGEEEETSRSKRPRVNPSGRGPHSGGARKSINYGRTSNQHGSQASGMVYQTTDQDLMLQVETDNNPSSKPVAGADFESEPLTPTSPTPVQRSGTIFKRKRNSISSLEQIPEQRKLLGRPCKRCNKKTLECDSGGICLTCMDNKQQLFETSNEKGKQRGQNDSSAAKDNQQMTLDKEMIRAMQEFWDNVGTLPDIQALGEFPGKRIVLKVSTQPFHDIGHGALISAALGGSSDDSSVDALDLLCDELSTKLRIHDRVLPADVATKLLALAQQQGDVELFDSRSSDDLKLPDLLNNIVSILVLLESLPDWAVYTTPGDTSFASTVIALAYGCLLERFLEFSDVLWERVRLAIPSNEASPKSESSLAVRYYLCIKRVLALNVGVKLDHIWNPMQSHLQNRLARVRSHFGDAGYPPRPLTENVSSASMLPSANEKGAMSNQDNYKHKDPSETDEDFADFLAKSSLEVSKLRAFHLSCYLGDDNGQAHPSHRILPSSSSNALEAITVRTLLEGSIPGIKLMPRNKSVPRSEK